VKKSRKRMKEDKLETERNSHIGEDEANTIN
jgi:hypothetical protein